MRLGKTREVVGAGVLGIEVLGVFGTDGVGVDVEGVETAVVPPPPPPPQATRLHNISTKLEIRNIKMPQNLIISTSHCM
jgi:hypothetical protein